LQLINHFDNVLSEYRTVIFRYLYRLVQRQSVAETLAEEVFLEAYLNGASADPPVRFKLDLFRRATNLAFRHLADRTAVSRRAGKSCAPAVSALRRAIAALSWNQRAVVSMHRYEGLTFSEIAEVLACPETVARELLVRAYAKLRGEFAMVADTGSRPIALLEG
jgi:RNA polymerase sigma-70 factor, ECF subfamily